MMDNESSYVSRKESFEIENPEVYVETVSSNVRILESTDGKCHVEISTKSGNERRLEDWVDITANEQKVSVRVGKKNGGLREFLSGRSSDLFIVIRLTKKSALKVKTVSADIEINQALASIEVSSVSGDIAVFQNPTTMCALKTVSGDIAAHTFSACQYALKSVSGDISVHVAPGLEIDVDGKSVSGDLESEISLSSNNDSAAENSEAVTISASTISGDFILARN